MLRHKMPKTRFKQNGTDHSFTDKEKTTGEARLLTLTLHDLRFLAQKVLFVLNMHNFSPLEMEEVTSWLLY